MKKIIRLLFLCFVAGIFAWIVPHAAASVSKIESENQSTVGDVKSSRYDLMPYPKVLSSKDGRFVVDKDFNIVFKKLNTVRLQLAAKRALKRLEKQSGINFSLEKKSRQRKLLVYVGRDDTDGMSKLGDESYRLRISSKKAVIRAKTPVGALRGIETFLQLVTKDEGSVYVPAVDIIDEPRFKWRGVLIDSVRHFFSVDTIKRQLEGMAAAKFNVFHWHLTDDQGWRIESKVFPDLHIKGSDGLFYSQKEIKEVIDYAHRLGLYVLPEIDMPGHTSALAIAYPELMSQPGPYFPEERWGVHKPLMNPANEDVYQFIDKLTEEMVGLFPFEYLHIGGDEVDPEHWETNPEIQQFMRDKKLENSQALHSYFNRRVADIFAKYDKKMIGWDEIQHPDLPKDIIVQSWQGVDSLVTAVENGFQSILSTGYYLDQPQPASYHYRNDPEPRETNSNPKIESMEWWSSWEFSISRRRGSNVEGILTLYKNTKQDNISGVVDFAGRSRVTANSLQMDDKGVRFWVDTWMGKTAPRFIFDGDQLSGTVIVGNTHYSVKGKKIAGVDIAGSLPPKAKTILSIAPENRHLLLGGEAALWSELVDENSIDLRLWPRGFVVAERLWSPRSLNDVNDMYRRLGRITEWSETSLGLRHKIQSINGMERLTQGANISPLLILSEAVEAAQYYHRHHEKSQHESYSRKDPLNRFVDTLPSENTYLIDLNTKVEEWLQTRDQDLKKAIVSQFEHWLDNNDELIQLVNEKESLAELKPVVRSVNDVSEIALMLIDSIDSNKPLGEDSKVEIKAKLFRAQSIQAELVVSAAYVVESILDYIDS